MDDWYAEAIDNDFYREEETDICGLCGKPGADKIPHPVYWPGEQEPDSELVHEECEQAEAKRACLALTEDERADFLNSLIDS